MKIIRAMIVDDEPLARRGIKQLLAPHKDVEVAAEARNGKEALRLLRSGPSVDLLFLDVQMPELDGFAVLRHLDAEKLPAVIFVTAFDTFAVRAFEAHALDYLVKPVQEARFQRALQRARDGLLAKQALETSRKLADLLDTNALSAPEPLAQPDLAQRLVVVSNGGHLIINVSEVEWIQAEDYYAAIHIGRRRHLIRESLTSLEARLDRSLFVRIHRSALVNLAHVREIKSPVLGMTSLILRDGTQLPLGRRRRAQVAAAIRSFTFADSRRASTSG
jgi:two-component system, LytTR family, response regulator